MNIKYLEITILKAIGILVVVSCHTGANIFNLIGVPMTLTTELFPEYSYHMPLFIFASGYLYKEMHESHIWEFIKKRFEMIKKYYKSNLFYLILCTVLISMNFTISDVKLSLYGFFIEPFLGGFQFYFNGPGWFVPFLFLLQICYVLIRKYLYTYKKNEKDYDIKNRETIFMLILMIIGLISTYLSNLYPVDKNMNMIHAVLRILFGLQFFQMGYFYSKFIKDKIKYSIKSFSILVCSKFLFFNIFGYYTYSMRTVKFNDYVVFPLLVSVLGILYCLHITNGITRYIKFINEKEKSCKKMSFIYFLGVNTWPIMIHHLFVKWSLTKLYNLIGINDSLEFMLSYILTPILCVILPLTFSHYYEKIKNRHIKESIVSH